MLGASRQSQSKAIFTCQTTPRGKEGGSSSSNHLAQEIQHRHRHRQMEQAGFKHLTLTRPHLILLEINSWGHGQDSTSPGPLGILCKGNQSYPSPVLCSCLVHSCPMPTQSPVDLKSHSPPIANAVLLLNLSQGPEAEELEMPMLVQNSSC